MEERDFWGEIKFSSISTLFQEIWDLIEGIYKLTETFYFEAHGKGRFQYWLKIWMLCISGPLEKYPYRQPSPRGPGQELDSLLAPGLLGWISTDIHFKWIPCTFFSVTKCFNKTTFSKCSPAVDWDRTFLAKLLLGLMNLRRRKFYEQSIFLDIFISPGQWSQWSPLLTWAHPAPANL